jgi:hypothetical protein
MNYNKIYILLKPAGYNMYLYTRARYPYPCLGIGRYTGTGLRRAGHFFLEKTRCTSTRLPAARARTRVPVVITVQQTVMTVSWNVVTFHKSL